MFGGSLFPNMESDPIFGAHSRAMSRMMGSFFGDFGGFGAQSMGPQMGMDMMPFGMPMQMNRFSPFDQINRMMGMGGMGGMGGMNMNNMMAMPGTIDNNGAAFQSMSFMSVTSNGGDGQPHVYQASSQTRQAGGMKETRKAVQDSRSGVKKMSHGRHIGERGHVLEREENLFTGQREEHEDLINLDHDDKTHFQQEWRNRAHHGVGGYERRQLTDGSASHPHHLNNTASTSRGPRVTHPHHHPHAAGRSIAATATSPSYSSSGVTIEEVNSDNEETTATSAQPLAIRAAPVIITPAPATTSTSSPTRRHRERRHKQTKRSRKMY